LIEPIPEPAASRSSLPEIDTIVLDDKTLRRRVRQLGSEITRDYQCQEVTIVCILTGAFTSPT
jgi:hypoxanthine-guanine phosphoribosyltransferase